MWQQSAPEPPPPPLPPPLLCPAQMVLPFWSGATWDKQHGVDVERKR